MKKWIMAIVCLMTMVLSANAQKSSEFSYMEYQKYIVADDTYIPTKEQTPSVMLAGKYLKKSANSEIASTGFAVLSGGFAALTTIKGINEDQKQMFIYASGICGFMSLVCYVAKIHYKWKSGKTLELCGDGVRLNF